MEAMYVREMIDLVTNDHNGNTFNFTIHEGESIFDLTGKTVKLLVKSQNGTTIMDDCTLSTPYTAGKAYIVLPSDMFQEGGAYVAEVQIYQGVNRITTLPFDYTVRLSLETDESVLADNRYSLLQQALIDVEDAQTQAAAAASTASTALTQANSAVTTINNQIANVNNTATTVNTLKTTVESMIANMDRVVEEELPPVSSRIAGVFYWKYYVIDGVRKVAWIEDHLGNKYDIHDYPTKLLSMNPDGTFPATPCAHHFIRGLTVKGQTARNLCEFNNNIDMQSLVQINAVSGKYTKTASNTKYVAIFKVLSFSGTPSLYFRAEQGLVGIGVISSTGLKKVEFTTGSTVNSSIPYIRLDSGGEAITGNSAVLEFFNVVEFNQESYVNTRLPYGLSSVGDYDITDNPLRILPNLVQDTIDNVATGAVTRRTAKMVLNGSEAWAYNLYQSTTDLSIVRFALTKTDALISSDFGNSIWSDRFKNRQVTGTIVGEGISLNSSTAGIHIAIFKSRLSGYSESLTDIQKANLFKTWLTSNNTNIEYQLATQTTETVDTAKIKPFLWLMVNGRRQRVQITDNLRKIGTVADELGVRRISGWVNLSTLPWTQTAAVFTDFKQANATLTGHLANSLQLTVIKYDGKMLNPNFAQSADNCALGGSSVNIYVPNSDSGFSNASNIVTINEWKAYFYGWKMCNPDGSAWDGVSTKHWKKITDGTGLTNVLPTASYTGFTPYKMIYQLATPTYETVDITTLQTIQGDNVIKNLNSVIPDSMTATVCQTNQNLQDQITALQNLALL
jgi:hypothetical protein